MVAVPVAWKLTAEFSVEYTWGRFLSRSSARVRPLSRMSRLSTWAMGLRLTWLVLKGKNGLALTIVSLLGAGFSIMIYATNHDFGIDPVRAIGIALVFFLPALLGSAAGAIGLWTWRFWQASQT